MPFYDALQYILTTALGKVRRRNWLPNTYIMKGFKNECMGIILVNTSGKKLDYWEYTAKPEDMLAIDWCIVTED